MLKLLVKLILYSRLMTTIVGIMKAIFSCNQEQKQTCIPTVRKAIPKSNFVWVNDARSGIFGANLPTMNSCLSKKMFTIIKGMRQLCPERSNLKQNFCKAKLVLFYFFTIRLKINASKLVKEFINSRQIHF